jgi:hypothetical protein
MSAQPECIGCGDYVMHGPCLCDSCTDKKNKTTQAKDDYYHEQLMLAARARVAVEQERDALQATADALGAANERLRETLSGLREELEDLRAIEAAARAHHEASSLGLENAFPDLCRLGAQTIVCAVLDLVLAGKVPTK